MDFSGPGLSCLSLLQGEEILSQSAIQSDTEAGGESDAETLLDAEDDLSDVVRYFGCKHCHQFNYRVHTFVG